MTAGQASVTVTSLLNENISERPAGSVCIAGPSGAVGRYVARGAAQVSLPAGFNEGKGGFGAGQTQSPARLKVFSGARGLCLALLGHPGLAGTLGVDGFAAVSVA